MEAVFFTGQNQYGVVSYFIDGMVDTLEKLSFRCHVINIPNDGTPYAINQATLNHVQPTFILSFNGLGLDIQVNNEPYLANFKCPKFVFLVDHPIHLIKRFWGTDTIVLCVDKAHVVFCELCGLKAEFFPHALSEEQYIKNSFTDMKYKRGTIAPLSYFDTEHWFGQLNPVWNQISPIIEKASNIWEFMCQIGVVPNGNSPAKLGITDQTLSLLRCVDYYYRGIKRTQAVKKLSRLDNQITVCGRNSTKFAPPLEQLTLEPSLNVTKLFPAITSSRYLLHSVPGFSAALHDRILFSVANGTLVISDDLSSISHIEPDLEILDLDNFRELSDLQYDHHRNHNLEVLLAKHNWRIRFETLLETYL